METTRRYLFIFATVFAVLVELDAVTVSTALCPTNKIAPRRHSGSRDQYQPRTLGVFYDLLSPNRPYIDPLNDLQEQPQEDDPNDCGEIDDYDETDLSSVTQYAQRKKDRRHNRTIFSNSAQPPYPPANVPSPQRPQRPPSPQRPQRPPSPQRPQRPPSTRPPFWSGGIFGSNVYRPPVHQYPSNQIKPVHEDTLDTYATYRPEVVGGPLGHVVGFSPARPTRYPDPDTTTHKRIRFPDYAESHTRAPRARPLNRSGIVGSFVDLFFK